MYKGRSTDLVRVVIRCTLKSLLNRDLIFLFRNLRSSSILPRLLDGFVDIIRTLLCIPQSFHLSADGGSSHVKTESEESSARLVEFERSCSRCEVTSAI